MANGIPSPIGMLSVPQNPAAQVIAGTFRGIEEILRDADERELMLARLGLAERQFNLQSQQFKAENALADRRLTELIANNKAEREFREDQATRRHNETMRALDIRETAAQARERRAQRSDALAELSAELTLGGEIDFVPGEGDGPLQARFTPRAPTEEDEGAGIIGASLGAASTGEFVNPQPEPGESPIQPTITAIQNAASTIADDPQKGLQSLTDLALAVSRHRELVEQGVALPLDFESLLPTEQLAELEGAIAAARRRAEPNLEFALILGLNELKAALRGDPRDREAVRRSAEAAAQGIPGPPPRAATDLGFQLDLADQGAVALLDLPPEELLGLDPVTQGRPRRFSHLFGVFEGR